MSTADPTVTSASLPRQRTGVFSDRAFAATFLLIGLLIGIRVFATISALPSDAHMRVRTHGFSDDAKRYHEIADSSGVPYRDVAVEFPPAALGMIEAVNGPTVSQTMGRLAWASLALDMIAAGAVAFGWGKRAFTAYLVLGLPFFYLPFVYFRVDLLSVALAAWGVALVKCRHDAGGGALLALAVFAKLWPVALIPLLIVERRWKALRWTVAIGAAGAMAWFAVADIDGFEQVLTFRHAKGWQVESVAGGIVRVFTTAPVHIESGAVRFGDAPFWATGLLAAAMLAVVAIVWTGVWRRSRDEGITYAVAPIASVGTFMVCSPLLSPQYLIWLLPFAAIAWVAGRRLLAGLVAACFAVTLALTQFYEALNRNDLSGHVVLGARNAMLVGIVAYALILVWRRGDGAGPPHRDDRRPDPEPREATRMQR